MADSLMSLKELLAFQPNAPVAPSVAPMAQVAPQLSPTAQYVNDMQTLLRGGIGKLSTGEKLGAIGQILQAAGSRGAADPGAVIQNVRQQQMQKLNAQYQIAQLQQKAEQERQQQMAIEQAKTLLTDRERAGIEGLPIEKQAEKISEITTRPKQVQQIVRAADGRTRIIYQNGEDQIANWSLPPKTKYENLGDRLLLVDEDTGQPVLDADGKPQELKVNMTPSQAANYGLAVRRDARGGAGGGGGGPVNYQFRTTASGDIVAFNPRNPTQTIKTGQKAQAQANPFGPLFAPPTGKPVFGK